jgi:hypothetical protein
MVAQEGAVYSVPLLPEMCSTWYWVFPASKSGARAKSSMIWIGFIPMLWRNAVRANLPLWERLAPEVMAAVRVRIQGGNAPSSTDPNSRSRYC